MGYYFEDLSDKDRKPVIDIFNYFIENSFAAYLETKVGYDFFDRFLAAAEGYPAITVKDTSGKTVGFAFLHAYNPMETFKRVATITYFIMPEHTRKGIGKAILDCFIEEAKKLNIDSILANISSLNERSLSFHLKYGFKECGRFRKIGKKFDKDFDVIWVQKELDVFDAALTVETDRESLCTTCTAM
jgi:phosphinothricin acetyltransferase